MDHLDHRRRAGDTGSALAATSMSETVRHGILLQRASTTVAAVEYLTARGIDAGVIRRVLRGDALREVDRMALALQQQALDQAAAR